jgi:SAM-dependent methyltransferase
LSSSIDQADKDQDEIARVIAQRQQDLRRIIARAQIDTSYIYDDSALIEDRVLALAAGCESILDVGRSSRQFFHHFSPQQVTTLDINQFDGYPDLIDDLCDPLQLQDDSYDGLVCLSVIEHVYAPEQAVRSIYRCLKPGGYAFVHVPFVFRYHAPGDLSFQDYYRFTRDGVAYLFRDFDPLVLYPVRGRLSSAMNLQRFWKKRIEKRFGHRLNRWIDRVYDRLAHPGAPELQTSGYFIWAQKPR